MTASSELKERQASSSPLHVVGAQKAGVSQGSNSNMSNRPGSVSPSTLSQQEQRRPSRDRQNSSSPSHPAALGLDSDSGGNQAAGGAPRRRRGSLVGAATRRKNSNTSLGNAINAALGNNDITAASLNEDLGLLSSEEDDDEIDNDDDDMNAPSSSTMRNRTRSNSNTARSTDDFNDEDDDYREESFSGPMHYVRLPPPPISLACIR